MRSNAWASTPQKTEYDYHGQLRQPLPIANDDCAVVKELLA